MSIQAQIEAYAKQDLKAARNRGVISIINTKIGVVELSYNAGKREYTLSHAAPSQPMWSDKASGMISYLTSHVYQIVREDV
jgi:hypothetical protein